MVDLVKAIEGQALTDSFVMCGHFGKTHHHILRAIDNLVRNLTNQKRRVKKYFVETQFINARNRQYRGYNITRKGFTLLAMGFTGDKALKFKLDYIDAFDWMEEELKRISISRLIGIETRKVMTDSIKESDENDRMKGHAYSNYTKLVYRLAGIPYEQVKDFRNTLSPDELNRVESIEGMINILIKAGQQYQEIKQNLNLLFVPKLTEGGSK